MLPYTGRLGGDCALPSTVLMLTDFNQVCPISFSRRNESSGDLLHGFSLMIPAA
jgi:hypothetical protein